jgi:hypothetical protein
MIIKKVYQTVIYARGALYSAFGSPGHGITWSVVTFLTGLLYVIYREHKRSNLEVDRKEAVAQLESSEAATQGDTSNM